MKRIIFDLKKNILIYLFVLIQSVIIILTLNGKVSAIVDQYKWYHFIESYGENLWVYENYQEGYQADEDTMLEDYMAGLKNYVNKLNEVSGVQGIGYYRYTYVDMEGHPADEEENRLYYFSPVMEEIRCKLREGCWFNEVEEQGDMPDVILGGDIAEQYKAGDIITLTSSDADGAFQGKVIGILAEDGYLPNLNVLNGAFKFLSAEEFSGQSIILTNDEEAFSAFGINYMCSGSLILKLDDNADFDTLESKGFLFRMEESEKHLDEFFQDYFKTMVSKNILLFAVILFGVSGCTCLIIWNRKKEIAIYYFLGIQKRKLMAEISAVSICIYCAAIAIVRIFFTGTAVRYEYVQEFKWTGMNTIISVSLTGFMILLNILIVRHMCGKSPKEMLTEAKEEMA